jgi:hypothetical protein
MDARDRARLFKHVFKYYNGRFPDAWESTLGLALVDGKLTVRQRPAASTAPALWGVHETALTVQAALS